MQSLFAVGAGLATLILIAVVVVLSIAEPLGALLAFGSLAISMAMIRAPRTATSMDDDEEVGK